MSDPSPKRRWLRFSLRTLMEAVAVLGVFLVWNFEQVRYRELLLREIAARGATFVNSISSPPKKQLPLICACGELSPSGQFN